MFVVLSIVVVAGEILLDQGVSWCQEGLYRRAEGLLHKKVMSHSSLPAP